MNATMLDLTLISGTGLAALGEWAGFSKEAGAFLTVHWALAQAVFDTVDLTRADWLLAAAIASSTLLLEEARKLLLIISARLNRETSA